MCFAAVLALLGGCEASHSLGGALDKVADDAGADADSDAWVPASVLEPRFDPPSGDVQQLMDLREAMWGDWWGITSYNEENSELFEVNFDRDGTYSTHCLIAAPCEPFGMGSDGDHGFSWELFTLDSDGSGWGEIHSVSAPPLSVPIAMRMSSVRYRPQKELLSFVLAGVSHSDDPFNIAPFAQVALRRGKFEGDQDARSAAP